MQLVTIRLTEDEYAKLESYSQKARMSGTIRSASPYAECQQIVRMVLKVYEDHKKQASRDSA
jgi:hypothetical protein